MRSPRPPGCLLVALVIGFGCSNTKAPAPNDHTVDKVVVVVMENYGYNDVIGSSETPYLNRTILHGSISLTNMDAETHPSLPNYAYLVAGTICGSNDDADWDLTCRTLFDQLTDAGVDWRTYAEGYPGDASTCDLTPSTEGESSNDYARKHVPQLLFSSTSSGTPCTKHMANFPGDTPADDAPPTANFAGASFPPQELERSRPGSR